MKPIPMPNTKYNFFASSNSYDGFISYFDSVFNRDFRKIFVLKGGPGTGKSTVIKKVAAYANSQNFHHEAIYCSSDPNSLDGIIIESEKGKIAVIDGTAPHERDAIVPGVIDELVNLGDGWKTEMLEAKRSDVINLNSKKAMHYKKAYDNLHLSSIFARKIKAEIAKFFNFEKAEHSVNMLCREIYSSGDGKRDIRLISSFSKYGSKKISTLENISDRIYRVYGKFGTDEIYLNLLKADLQKTDMNYTILPTALDKNSADAIYLGSDKTSVMTCDSETAEIDTLDFVDKDALYGERDTFITYGRIRDYFLEKARENLEKASEFHFELEDIYTPAMDFLLIDEYSDRIIEKCINILE